MDINSIPVKLCVLVVVGIATYTDIKSHKIPNKLTFPAALIGLGVQAAYYASFATPVDMWFRAGMGVLNGILGWITGVIIMGSIKFFLKKMGHGDTKLVAAIGSFLGPAHVFIIYLYYSLIFGLYSIFRFVPAIPWKEMWLASEARKAGVEPAPIDRSNYDKVAKEVIPVGPFIAAGAILEMIFEEPSMRFLGFSQ